MGIHLTLLIKAVKRGFSYLARLPFLFCFLSVDIFNFFKSKVQQLLAKRANVLHFLLRNIKTVTFVTLCVYFSLWLIGLKQGENFSQTKSDTYIRATEFSAPAKSNVTAVKHKLFQEIIIQKAMIDSFFTKDDLIFNINTAGKGNDAGEYSFSESCQSMIYTSYYAESLRLIGNYKAWRKKKNHLSTVLAKGDYGANSRTKDQQVNDHCSERDLLSTEFTMNYLKLGIPGNDTKIDLINSSSVLTKLRHQQLISIKRALNNSNISDQETPMGYLIFSLAREAIITLVDDESYLDREAMLILKEMEMVGKSKERKTIDPESFYETSINTKLSDKYSNLLKEYKEFLSIVDRVLPSLAIVFTPMVFIFNDQDFETTIQNVQIRRLEVLSELLLRKDPANIFYQYVHLKTHGELSKKSATKLAIDLLNSRRPSSELIGSCQSLDSIPASPMMDGLSLTGISRGNTCSGLFNGVDFLYLGSLIYRSL